VCPRSSRYSRNWRLTGSIVQNTSVPTPNCLLHNDTFDILANDTYLSSRTGPWTAKPFTAVAFLSLSQAIDNNTGELYTLVESSVNSTIDSIYLPIEYTFNDTNTSPLIRGYARQRDLVTSSLLSYNTPAYEILNDNSGGLDLALMHPLSRGTVHITSTNILDEPAVNPNWLSHPLDLEILISAMYFNNRILTSPSYATCYEPTMKDQPDRDVIGWQERKVLRKVHNPSREVPDAEVT
jgi:choline dehydrogenase-like flavoprotein